MVTEAQEPIPNRSDITKAKRLTWLRHLAHESVMLNRMTRLLGRAERMEKFAASGNANELSEPGYSDDMGVNLGNETHNHYEIKSSLGALLAILFATGIALLLFLLWWQWQKPDDVVVDSNQPDPPTFTDTDTDTHFYFGDPKPIEY